MNALLPIVEDIRNDINLIKETVTLLNTTVNDLNETVEEGKHDISNLKSSLEILINNPPLNRIALTVLGKLLPYYINNLQYRLQDRVKDSENRLAGDLHDGLLRQNGYLADLTWNMECIKKDLNDIKDAVIDFPEVPLEYMCGGTGGWRRVVYLNMTDPNTNCPIGWQLTGYSTRTCGRVTTGQLACDSVFFPVAGGNYTRVCGSIRAYQYAWPDGFETYHIGTVTTIDGAYVSGISLTHGNPRQHIWTFACGVTEGDPTRADVCPCDASVNINIPQFVGDDYFCESGIDVGTPLDLHTNDPLWDGAGCSNAECCEINNPPYFIKELPSPTSDPIEARLCEYNDYTSEFEDTPIEFIELYVQ